MSGKSQQEGPSLILMAAPATAILLGYGFFFHTPQQKQIGQQQKRLQALSQQEQQTRVALAESRAKRSKLLTTIRTNRQELQDAKSMLQSAELRRSALQRDVLAPTTPASSMRKVTGLLEDNGLAVVQSEPVNQSDLNAEQVLKPIVSLLADKGDRQSMRKDKSREVYSITLSGTFPELRRALQELADLLPLAVPLSVELEESGPRVPSRTWRLVIMV